MHILDLPVEIGNIIFTYLDTKSKINVYNIHELRRFCVARKLDLSRSTLATAKTLNLNLFQDLAEKIIELNLSGINDLTVDKLAPYIRKCTNLKTLDITFTRIYVTDLESISCDTLKNIGINFCRPRCYRPEHLDPWVNDKETEWKKIYDLFQRQKFEQVHFVVFEVNELEYPFRFMRNIPVTKNFEVTLADWGIKALFFSTELNKIGSSKCVHFEKLCYNVRDCHAFPLNPSEWLRQIVTLDYSQIEYIFIMYSEKITIEVSPEFSRIFTSDCCDLTVKVSSHLTLDFEVSGNIIFKAWNKNVTIFNEKFFKDLLREIQDYFPTYVCMHGKTKMNITEAPSNWYCIDSCDNFDGILESIPEKVTLTDFCRKSYAAQWEQPITSSPELEMFKNITFLSLKKVFLNDDFFTHLFARCKKLCTLDVYIEYRVCTDTDCTLSLFDSLHQTKLKNLKLMLEDIDYDMVFQSLAKCPTLENIHIFEYNRYLSTYELNEKMYLPIENCCNLYSLYVEATMDLDTLIDIEHCLTNAGKELGRDHLIIAVKYSGRGWNPFADVFSPSPLHITQ